MTELENQVVEAYAVFCGPIDQDSVGRIFRQLTFATQQKIGHVHILFQSTGGYVGDGIALYAFFRTLPIDLTLYNAGGVQSIAALAYLGAKKRVTSARAIFMIHKTTSSPQGANVHTLRNLTDSVTLDDSRTEAIFREHLNLADDRWMALQHSNLYFSGEEAVKLGFADEIGDFAPPKGALIYSI